MSVLLYIVIIYLIIEIGSLFFAIFLAFIYSIFKFIFNLPLILKERNKNNSLFSIWYECFNSWGVCFLQKAFKFLDKINHPILTIKKFLDRKSSKAYQKRFQ